MYALYTGVIVDNTPVRITNVSSARRQFSGYARDKLQLKS